MMLMLVGVVRKHETHNVEKSFHSKAVSTLVPSMHHQESLELWLDWKRTGVVLFLVASDKA